MWYDFPYLWTKYPKKLSVGHGLVDWDQLLSFYGCFVLSLSSPFMQVLKTPVSLNLSYALGIHGAELIKLIRHCRKFQWLWVLTFNVTIVSENQCFFFIEMHDKFPWFMQILDCTGDEGLGVVASTSVDFVDVVWVFQIFIVI